MGFGNFLKGAIAQINPFDNGKTYGSYNPPQKKKLPGDPGYQAPVSRVQTPNLINQPTDQNQQNGVQAQRPDNLFAGLNQNLMIGGNRPGIVPVFKSPDTNPAPAPTPAPVSKPSIWDKIRDTVVGSVANLPEVGLAAGRAATGIVQGVGELPHAVTSTVATGTQELQKHMNNPVTRQVNRGFQDVNTGVKTATHYAVNDAIDPLNRGLDTAAKMYERNVPQAVAGSKVYRNTQIPINALAAVATLGGSTAGDVGEAANAANDASKLSRAKAAINAFLNKPLLANEDNLISRVGRPVINRTRPIVEALNTPIKSAKQGVNVVRDLINNRGVQDIGRGAVDAGEVSNLLSDTGQVGTTPTKIPVTVNVPVQGPEAVSQPINVRNLNEPKPLIQEFPGDASIATPNALAQHEADQARLRAAEIANRAVPDVRIEGVTPRTPDKPFVLTPEAKATGQAKVVQDYADTLRSMGEGNGTQLVPDGQGGYTRTSNNFRSADNAGKRMSKAAWLDEAQQQLSAGKAEPGIQKAFNDAANPEVQSALAKGEQPTAPEGRPITVKQVNGINVVDNTNVPQNLPETPGTVRVTEATALSNAKSEAIAAQTPPPAATKAVEAAPAEVASGATTETLPRPNETDETFLKRVAEDMQTNIKRAVDSLKMTKKMTKVERANRAAAGEKAYQDAKTAGLSMAEQEAARKAAYSGEFDRTGYAGTPIHSADEQRLRDMVDAHYADMPYQAGNVREAFSKLFHGGEPGWQSEAGNHIIPSDIKNIRKFLNESVPNPDGNGGLGDFAESAIKELAAQENGPGKIANAIGLQRALRFTADISATGRQALPGALSHPVEFAKAAAKSFEVMFSHENYQKYVSELANNKEANYINDRLGAHLSVLNDDISKADDIYRNSSWAQKIPGVNQVVAASERQYNTILTEMRYQSGKRFIDAAGGVAGLEKAASDSGDAEGFLRAIGTVTNVNTGRGEIDTNGSKILSNVLVSPRGLAARIQRFNPKYYTDLAKANPAAAKEALRSLAIQTAVTTSALAAASKAGIYEDGQIKVGNTRYDITGGVANMVRTAVRVAQYISGDRATTPFNNAESEVTKWARNQLAPFLSSTLDTIGLHQDKNGTWVNRWGENVTLGSTILNNIAPVNASQVNSDLQLNTSPGQTAANALLNTAGIGVNTYKSSGGGSGPAKSVSTGGGGGTGNKYSPQAKAASTAELDSLKANAGAGYSLQKLPNGEYAYNIDGTIKTNSSLKTAQQDIAKDSFEKSGKNYTVLGDTVLRRGTDGKATVVPKIKFDYQLGTATLTQQKSNDDLPGYLKTAESQLKSIDEQLKDPSIDPLDAITLQNEAQTLVNNVAKYKSYGGFTKPKSGSGVKKLDTSFGTLKTSSSAPTVQQYTSIAAKAGNVPYIKTVRPNIVHNISSSRQNKTMAAIDNIRKLAQKTFYTINGAQNDDTGADLTIFENDFILGFNLWKEEFEAEAYWNKVRVDDYELTTISDTTTFSFELPDDFRTPVIQPDKYLKFITDGIVIAKFKMVDPNQRQVDVDIYRPDRATFVGRNIVLSRAPKATEVGAVIVLDVVEFIPDLTRTDDSALDLLPNSQVAVLGVAKNNTLADVTKVSLSPSFSQKYNNELNKALAINNASNEVDEMQSEDYAHIGGIW